MEAALSFERGLAVLAWLSVALVLLPMLVVVAEIIGALLWRARYSPIAPLNLNPHTVVLIPAHNEQGSIGRAIGSLSVALPSNCYLLCVAHNCTDQTAEIARQLGAQVLEVKDDGQGGKPDAIKAGLRCLDAAPPEIVVIVDADCTVSPGAIQTLAVRARETNRPVMAVYCFAPAVSEQGLSVLSSLAVLLKNYVRPLGLHRFGLPCLINGSGSAYPFSLIRNVPHGDGSIAEDYQLTIDLLRKGYPTLLVPEARVDGQLPTPDKIALRQRRRWEHGHLFLTFRVAPRLLFEGLLRLDKNRIALAVELGVPPLAFLGVLMSLALGVALLLQIIYGDHRPLSVLLVAMLLFVLAILLSWLRFAGIRQTVTGLVALPRYVLWKLPMYRDFFTRRETRWVKTERD